jgi:hypothetical protein
MTPSIADWCAYKDVPANNTDYDGVIDALLRPRDDV